MRFDFLGKRSKKDLQRSIEKYEKLYAEKNKLEALNQLLMEIINNTERRDINIIDVVFNDKIDEYVLVYKQIDNYHIYVKAPNMLSTTTFYPSNTQIVITYRKEENLLYIEDIPNSSHKDMGFGSIAMTYLISEAKKNKINRITGHMVYYDIEHKERQIHFYKKHGFIFSGDWISREISQN